MFKNTDITLRKPEGGLLEVGMNVSKFRYGKCCTAWLSLWKTRKTEQLSSAGEIGPCRKNERNQMTRSQISIWMRYGLTPISVHLSNGWLHTSNGWLHTETKAAGYPPIEGNAM